MTASIWLSSRSSAIAGAELHVAANDAGMTMQAIAAGELDEAAMRSRARVQL